METFTDFQDVDRFIHCTKGLTVGILIDPRDADIKKLLYAGFGHPKLVDGKLSLSRIPGERFQYLRDAVIPQKVGTPLLFSPTLLANLDKMRRSAVEWGGMFIFIGGEMKMASQRRGTENTVNLGTELSKYMYHNHPYTEWLPYTMYSSQDMKRYLFDNARYGSPRKDYLVQSLGFSVYNFIQV